MQASYESAMEIAEAINELTKEVKQLRELLAKVIDSGSGSYPGYVRAK